MTKKDINNYRKWLTSKECKEHLKNMLESSGVPLELRSNTLFEQKGYRCTSTNYFDDFQDEMGNQDRKNRELDIYARKTIHKFTIGDCEVNFDIKIFSECKSVYKKSFIAFEHSTEHMPIFPITYSGRKMTYVTRKLYDFPITIRKVVEMEVPSFRIISDKEYNTIYDGCSQLTSATSFFYDRFKQSQRFMMPRLQRFVSQYPEDTRENIEKNYTVMDIINMTPLFSVVLTYAILVLSENSGLIKAEYDPASGNISDFLDVGYGIYPFVPQYVDRYSDLIENHWYFPIIITTYGYLNECIDKIEDGAKKTSNQMEGIILKQPHNLRRLILDEMFGPF